MRPPYRVVVQSPSWCDANWGVRQGSGIVALYLREADAQAECDRLNATADGLHRLGVAVAVWAGMAAARANDPLVSFLRHSQDFWVRSAGMWREMYLAKREALKTERAARRKWELRLRSRAQARINQRKVFYEHDRLQWRARQTGRGQGPEDWGTVWWISRSIDGPRGVLP